MKSLLLALGLGCGVLVSALTTDLATSAESPAQSGAPVVWKLGDAESLAALMPEVGGAPRPLTVPEGGPGLRFDGVGDGLWLPVNPIAGCAAFTIEMLIRPEAGGHQEQRFFHVEDGAGNRGLLELRMAGANSWGFDAFLRSGDAKLSLYDRAKAHPAGRWTWVALRYDGRTLSAWVDGVKELEGVVAFAPMGPGRISLGVRQNRQSWFRGAIREVRIMPDAVPEARMQRPAE